MAFEWLKTLVTTGKQPKPRITKATHIQTCNTLPYTTINMLYERVWKSQQVIWTVGGTGTGRSPVSDPWDEKLKVHFWRSTHKQCWERENEKWPYHSYQWLFFYVHGVLRKGKRKQASQDRNGYLRRGLWVKTRHSTARTQQKTLQDV